MKYVYGITLLLLFVTNLSAAQKKDNDLLRYGLKGNVKTMEQTIYAYCKKIDNKWVATDTPYYVVRLYHFDNKGILQSLEDKHINTKTHSINYTLTKFNYKDSKLTGSEWFDSTGKKLGESKVKWANDYKYIDRVDDKDKQVKIETIHLLDNGYRNENTWMRRYNYNGLEANIFTHFTYTNGMLTGQILSDSLTGHTYNYIVEVVEKDAQENSKETAISIQPDNGMPAQLIFAKYDYYEE